MPCYLKRPVVEHANVTPNQPHCPCGRRCTHNPPVASAYLRLSGESLENRHTSSAQYKRDSSLLSEQWTQPAPMSASATSTHIELNTFAGVASGIVNWRRGGVGDLPPLAIGRSRSAPRFLNMVLCALLCAYRCTSGNPRGGA